MQYPLEVRDETAQDAPSLLSLIGEMARFLWKEWPRDMEAIGHDQNGNFALRGICPFPQCNRPSTFIRISATSVGVDRYNVHASGVRWVAVLQCQGCRSYILGIVLQCQGTSAYRYEEHYPMGFPDDEVADEVPADIAASFKEALRCRWVQAFSATVLMCRRALQVSCDLENAVGKDLYGQIDDLFSKGRITKTLKEMAHRIRLLGKRGAHADYSDIDATIGEDDADKAITFLRHYLDHVYVLPAQLAPPTEEAK